MGNLIFYLIGFFVVVYIARTLGEKAMKHLDTEQKAGLIDLFSKQRRYGSAIILCLVILFLIVLQFKLVTPLVAFSTYFVVMISYMLFKYYKTYTKLTENNYPPEYINKIVFASLLATLGVVTFFALIYYEFLMK
ncbi:MAG TPA: hypothetical protein PKN96_06825 [Flavobacterium sp.]|uniref:hypothetical protein n=1 Tax=Flavobacterium sp. TaxID=239 RepID=UPI002CDA1C69|nr:hypothetical protein [Flavobacterium sp.]HNP32989.1 hypothetical protein [Flavobacterium sp.]